MRHILLLFFFKGNSLCYIFFFLCAHMCICTTAKVKTTAGVGFLLPSQMAGLGGKHHLPGCFTTLFLTFVYY